MQCRNLPKGAAALLSTLLLCSTASSAPTPAPVTVRKPVTVTEVLAASTSADWRPLDPQNTLYLELAGGRVVIELAPQFAPLWIGMAAMMAASRVYVGVHWPTDVAAGIGLGVLLVALPLLAQASI